MIKVGLILYSVRDDMAKDPIGTVEKVAQLGYKNIEVCNHNAINDPGCGFGIPAEKLKETFDEFGSKVVSAHVFPFEKSDMKSVMKYNKTLGNNIIVNPMGKFTTYDDLMKQCEDMNRWGKICRDEGITYLYHNHYHEFKRFNGKSILDIMMENTDPQYLGMELDTFWTMRAGLDPVEQIKHFGNRIKLIHQKDFAWDAIEPINLIGLDNEDYEMKPSESFGINGDSTYAKNGGKSMNRDEADKKAHNSAFTEIGTGIMHIQDIIDAANSYSDAKYIILEQDFTRFPTQIDSVKKSMGAFKKFSGISWEN
jgi:sugar phosphate isomerase/epimerase